MINGYPRSHVSLFLWMEIVGAHCPRSGWLRVFRPWTRLHLLCPVKWKVISNLLPSSFATRAGVNIWPPCRPRVEGDSSHCCRSVIYDPPSLPFSPPLFSFLPRIAGVIPAAIIVGFSAGWKFSRLSRPRERESRRRERIGVASRGFGRWLIVAIVRRHHRFVWPRLCRHVGIRRRRIFPRTRS